MNEISFGRLTDLLPRQAWPHEALAFTPWLAANIEQLSEVVGIPLEITGTEIAVETFSADILARNPSDGTAVLIENQLEMTDHMHLGQIMTYLAGLQAQTVIWVAPKFREPHLSAIRWLNEHTADGFSFFAVRLRVVRIGDSPYAPIFGVVEKPNGWDRVVTEKRREVSGERDPLSDRRLGFWTRYSEERPGGAEAGIKPMRGWNAYFKIGRDQAIFSLFIAQRYVGGYVRPYWNGSSDALGAKLSPHQARLTETLGASFGGKNGHFLPCRADLDYTDQAQWAAIIDWMEARRTAYLPILTELLGSTADGQ